MYALIGNNTQPNTAIKPADLCQYPLICSACAVFSMSADTSSDLKPLNAKSTGYDITCLCKPNCTDEPASSIWNKSYGFKNNQTEWCNIIRGFFVIHYIRMKSVNSTGGTQIKSPHLKKRGISLQKQAKRDNEYCILTQFLSEAQFQIPQTGWVIRRICAHTPKWF